MGARPRARGVRTRSIKHRRGEIARWALEGGVRTSLQRRAGASEKALRVRFIPVGVWICRNVGHARQSPSLSANAREVSRGASVRRVERRVLTCDPGGRIASRVPAAAHRRGDARGQRGPSEKKKIFSDSSGTRLSGARLSRAPIARARSRRARHRRAHAVQTTHSRDLRAQIHPGEAYRTVAPKRARSLTSGGAPGRAREGAREGGKHRKAGNLAGNPSARKRGAPSPEEP